MGKGDQKTKKGKLFRKSYGVRRPRKKRQMSKRALQKNPQGNAPELKEQMTDIKVDDKDTASGSSK